MSALEPSGSAARVKAWLLQRSEAFRKRWSALLLRLPIVGPRRLEWTVVERYKRVLGREPQLNPPLRFTEHMTYRILHDRDPRLKVLCDKLAVRRYIADRVGERYVVPLLGVWKNPRRIDWNALPETFVLKPNQSSGLFALVHSRSSEDLDALRAKAAQWLRQDFFDLAYEWGYRGLPRRILAEPLLQSPERLPLIEAHAYTFGEEVGLLRILVGEKRTPQRSGAWFDRDGRRLSFKLSAVGDFEGIFPADEVRRIEELFHRCRPELVDASRRVAHGFDHMRVDFYLTTDGLKIGELTPYSSSGLIKFRPPKWDRELGDWWSHAISRSLSWNVATPVLEGLDQCLADEDGVGKRVAILGYNDRLATTVGLQFAQRIVLPFPEFTIEHLALSDQSCDFVLSEGALFDAADPARAAAETQRVLKPGGRFVHLPPPSKKAITENRLSVDGLRALFPESTLSQVPGGAPREGSVWVLGRKEDRLGVAPSAKAPAGVGGGYVFNGKPANFGLVACVKDEGPYLIEWIAYHLAIGFESITIYDNQSDDASAYILGPLSRAGIINAVYWPSVPNQNKQVGAYNDAAGRLAATVSWAAFFDLDEFLVLDPGVSLADLVPPDTGVGAVGIPWRIYGSSGAWERDTGLTVERFTRAARVNNEHVKSLVRLSDLDYMNVHVPRLRTGRIIDLEGADIDYACRGKIGRITQGSARINHYFCRSREEFDAKQRRGRGAVKPEEADQRRPESMFRAMDTNHVDMPDGPRLGELVRRHLDLLRGIVDGGLDVN